ncbi:lipid-A-disaccharide synthase [Pseudidiomarina marina]|uniref:Lipid-A-disaccharide synthase n=1 Tax=Pseudidiomarina marina TaxID=502366 RepID=A0A432YK97_9GAMM|nr:lipid-A-disaccharide synthase [Pseudidiomarina marina]RUO61318.1 lipid-A-disaccharide synthase [Pseudidiomarina marina]
MTTSTAPLIAVIAGEHSGDLLGAGMLRELRRLYPNAEFIGVGGPLMQAQGLQSLVPMEDLAVMGIAEVLGSLFKLLGHRRLLVNTFLERRPDVFIGIDAPDFNLPIAKRLKAAGIKTVHYVSPSVWAWRQGRIHGIKQAVDHVLCLLPFEKAFYDEHELAATFVGHPLADAIPMQWQKSDARAHLQLDNVSQWIGVLPGSRKGEIARMAPLFLQVAKRLYADNPALKFVTPMISAARAEQFKVLQQQIAPELPLTMIDGQSRDTMAACDALLLTSGTVTLEAMLIKRPMVVAYKFNWLTYQLIKRLFKARFFSLPNLLADALLVPEFAQEEATVDNLTAALALQLEPQAEQTVARFAELHHQLKQHADVLSAQVVSQLISD